MSWTLKSPNTFYKQVIQISINRSFITRCGAKYEAGCDQMLGVF
jgi:hypothetical protein